MKISEIGGEFAMINRFACQPYQDKDVLVGIGDDCAVLRYRPDKHLLVTTDMMVENDHFCLKWQTPYQVGMKLMEVNVSDVVTMGGTPRHAFLSMSLLKSTEVEFIEGFYEGLFASANKHGVLLVGGDTTHGTEYVFNITLCGEVEPTLLRLRSMAEAGDLICVTGTLGDSTAGFYLLREPALQDRFFKNGVYLNTPANYRLVKKHLEPKARLAAEGQTIARFAHAMIDVSDGLGSEVTHICQNSGMGARIDYAAIPLTAETREAAELLHADPIDWALYGGEDFQLVFTIPRTDLAALEKEFTDFSVVGEIVPAREGIYLVKNKELQPLKKGYDHFA